MDDVVCCSVSHAKAYPKLANALHVLNLFVKCFRGKSRIELGEQLSCQSRLLADEGLIVTILAARISDDLVVKISYQETEVPSRGVPTPTDIGKRVIGIMAYGKGDRTARDY